MKKKNNNPVEKRLEMHFFVIPDPIRNPVNSTPLQEYGFRIKPRMTAFRNPIKEPL